MKLIIYAAMILICIAIMLVLFYINGSTRKKPESWEKKILDDSFNERNKESQSCIYQNSYLEISEKDLTQKINVSIDGKEVNLKYKCIFKYNRFYFSLLDFNQVLGYSLKTQNEKLYLYNMYTNLIIDFANNVYKISNEACFSVPAVSFSGTWYVSLIDIVKIFNLKIVWNYSNLELRLYNSRDKERLEQRKRLDRPALIRLEDISAGGDYSEALSLQKLRIVADRLHKKNIPYHIAWVPRYKNPQKGVDNDLFKNFNIYNSDFLFTLDYMIARGGIVGLHGYTHQHGSGVSIEDSEFGIKGDPSVEAAETRVLAAIKTANQLNIPYKFFESPHYSSTEKQQAVFENYFNYIFEPCQGVWNRKPYISARNNKTIYVPAPIGYVHGDNIKNMLKRIRRNPEDSLGALFYHPYKEFDKINFLSTIDEYPEYTYSDTSMLNNILDCLEKESYSLVRLTDIKA